MKSRGCAIAGIAMAACWGGLWAVPAAAVDTPDHDVPYVGAAFHYELPDSARDSGNGVGFRVGGGYPLIDFGLPDSALELSFFGTRRSRDIDGRDDYQDALTLDYVYDFGLFGWDRGSWLPDFKPFVLGGLGAVYDDVRGNGGFHPLLDAGAGMLFPLPFHGWAVRTEFRVLGQQNHDSVPSRDFLFDYRFGIGLQIPLDFLTSHQTPPPPPPPVSVVPVPKVVAPAPPPASADADGDGVPDAQDHCPDTPAGVKVDARGCAIAQTVTFKSLQFDTGSANLTGPAKVELDAVARGLIGQPGLYVEIDGFTDGTGSAALNRGLSRRRAEAARAYLIGRTVPAPRLTARGFGSARPVAADSTAEGRAANRRIEFRFRVQAAGH